MRAGSNAAFGVNASGVSRGCGSSNAREPDSTRKSIAEEWSSAYCCAANEPMLWPNRPTAIAGRSASDVLDELSEVRDQPVPADLAHVAETVRARGLAVPALIDTPDLDAGGVQRGREACVAERVLRRAV